MVVLTDKQAYAAMFHFLKGHYERTGSDEIGGLLGGLSVLDDGMPADPAFSEDWRRAIESAVKGNGPGKLTLE